MTTAAQLFEHYVTAGEPAYYSTEKPSEHFHQIPVNGTVYLLIWDEDTNLYNVRREDNNLDLQLCQGVSEQDQLNWQGIQNWLDQQLTESQSPDLAIEPQPLIPPAAVLTLEDSVSLSVSEWGRLTPRQQISLAEASTKHWQNEPIVTTQVEQWIGQEAHLKRQMKELNDRFKEELATVKELEARGQRSLLNPFGAGAEQIETAQNAVQATQRQWKSHRRDYDQIQSRRSQRQQQETEHEAWSAHPDTQGARRIRELLQDPERRSQYQEVTYTADQLKQWETKVAPAIGRDDAELERIRLVRQHYLDHGEILNSDNERMRKDFQQHRQTQKSQQSDFGYE